VTRLPLLLALALLQTSTSGTPGQAPFFHYQRSISLPPAGSSPTPRQACVILDAATFAHAEPFLKDLRLSATDTSGPHEIPYVLTLSEAQGTDSEPARILNLGTRGRTLDFDLAMPLRPYTEVVLDLASENFLATAVVSGTQTPGPTGGTLLGSFNLFDLTGQHLSRNTTLHLQESSFPFLHISLTATPAGVANTFSPTPQSLPQTLPQMLQGATVPPSREAQILFTVAAQTSDFQQQHDTRGNRTVARFNLPQRVPIERVSFTLAPGSHTNFSRDVHISTHTSGVPSDPGDDITGTIQRVKLTAGTHEINQQQLSIPATLGANLQQPAEVEAAINNGDDPPLDLASVQLEMRQRSLCFQAPAAQQLTLFYGDPQLPAPVYDLARTYTPSTNSAVAHLGPEELNPTWRPRPDVRPYTERHPHLLWVVLLITICALALVAFRSAKKHLHHSHR